MCGLLPRAADCSVLIAWLLAPGPAFAADDTTLDPQEHGDWWIGMDGGVGAIHIEFPEGRISENKFYLGVRAEYVLNAHWVAGIEASGWLIQPGEVEYNANPPPVNFEQQIEGEGLAPVLLTARFYPWPNDNWYVKAGAGYVSHWTTQQGVTDRKSGTGGMLGAGYDFRINDAWDITSFISYSAGSTGDEDYDGITLAIGASYKFRHK